MNILKLVIIGLSFSYSMANAQEKLFFDVPEGAQAVSFFGKPLSMPAPSQKNLDNLATAKANYDENPMDADNIIWYGRRMAYTGDFRGAIEIF